MDFRNHNGLFTGADAAFRKELGPLIDLSDELQRRLDDYRAAESLAEQSERWEKVEDAHREIMATWRLSFLRARSAVNVHLAEMGLNVLNPEHENLRKTVQDLCQPSVTMAVSLLQFEDARKERRANLAQNTDW
ncbi:hypothetical protein [Phyllobacterium sophorae]|uniref:Uncharacterized protein n=1 Tax=Phyllobacterium sophorae TaxID=1520277 RepID=A0A2P7B365_9HYPH|nr:hypothetical protein [Phyllobacterium sophorae]PSH60896.1 hypothetical protein CU103_25370 [Phyllobacterium sophorae]